MSLSYRSQPDIKFPSNEFYSSAQIWWPGSNPVPLICANCCSGASAWVLLHNPGDSAWAVSCLCACVHGSEPCCRLSLSEIGDEVLAYLIASSLWPCGWRSLQTVLKHPHCAIGFLMCLCVCAQRQTFCLLIRNILSRLQATSWIEVVAGCLAPRAQILNKEDESLAPHDNLDKSHEQQFKYWWACVNSRVSAIMPQLTQIRFSIHINRTIWSDLNIKRFHLTDSDWQQKACKSTALCTASTASLSRNNESVKFCFFLF